MELLRVSSGDAEESSHSASSSPSSSASSEDLSPSWNVDVFFLGFCCLCDFNAGARPLFFNTGWETLRANAVAEWFFRRLTWDRAFRGRRVWEALRLSEDGPRLSAGGVGPDLWRW